MITINIVPVDETTTYAIVCEEDFFEKNNYMSENKNLKITKEDITDTIIYESIEELIDAPYMLEAFTFIGVDKKTSKIAETITKRV